MAPYELLERANNLRNRVAAQPRISVTELSRNKEWRDTLPKLGIIEITDRGDTAGWLVSEADMTAIIEGYTYLEQELERAQIAAMFDARKDSKHLEGEALKTALLERFEARKDDLRSIVDAG